MLVPAIALDSFVHDNIKAVKDQSLPLPEGVANDLERKGLVRVQRMDRRVDRALVQGAGAEILPGKLPAVGKGTPSSSSPAAQASRPTDMRTSPSSRRGGAKRRLGGT